MRPGIRPEERDGCGDGQFEEVAGADQRAGSRHAMLHFQEFHQPVNQRSVEVHLQRDGNGDQDNMEEPVGDVVGLEGEDENQRGQ